MYITYESASEYVRSVNYHGANKESAEKFLESVSKHIKYVQQFGAELGVPDTQLIRHDLSKFSVEEFPAYAHYFHGNKNESPVDAKDVADEFAFAWLNHIHLNRHHWQNWMFPDNYTPKNSNIENGVMFMPDNYALEMIADWMSASYCYTGNVDMSEWLHKNASRITLHSLTAEFVCEVLSSYGYKNLNFISKQI